MSFLRLAPGLALAGLLLTANPAAAQRESEARVSFHAGRAAWDRGAFARALELWSQSYALSPHPMMQINIGNAWLRLGRQGEAATAYRRYLATASAGATERAEVHALLARIGPAPRDAPRTGFDPVGGHVWTWVALSAAAVSAATSVGLWVDFESRFGAMAGTCGQSLAGCGADAIDGLRTERDASYALAGVAITGLATALVLWIVEGLP